MEHPTVLIVDDDAYIQTRLSEFLAEQGYRTVQAGDGARALRLVRDEPIDLMLLDLQMPQLDGLDVLRTLAQENTTMPVIVLSAYGTIQKAVEAMKLGAYDFLEKPLHLEHILLTIRRALDHARLQQDRARFVEGLRARSALVGQSPPMRRISDLIAKVAAAPVTVLIQGESGTGKELIAQAIHAASDRATGPFSVVNCAALPAELIESELFGHTRGAFTGAVQDQKGKVQLADRGTLFLDEIGDMSLEAQTKVLRLLESGEIQPLGGSRTTTVSVRVLTATNKDLVVESREGRFRADLYHRVNVITIHMPPLRDRREDIPDLVRHFLIEFCEENQFPSKSVSPEAMNLLMIRDWPGNVRELKHAVQKLIILVSGETITAQDVTTILDGAPDVKPDTPMTLREARRRFERAFIIESLTSCQWRVEETAQMLGLDRAYLYRKIKDLGIGLEEVEA